VQPGHTRNRRSEYKGTPITVLNRYFPPHPMTWIHADCNVLPVFQIKVDVQQIISHYKQCYNSLELSI